MSDERVIRAAELLREGDASSAFDVLDDVLASPGTLEPDDWASALRTFAAVAVGLFGDDWEAPGGAAAEAPDDARALAGLGARLGDEGFVGMARAVLERAVAIAPQDADVVTALVTLLEQSREHAEAVRVLEELTDATASFLLRYLLAFNAIFSFDVDRARGLAPELSSRAADDAERFMADRISGMLSRYDALSNDGPIDSNDVSAWHLVRTGGLLLDPGRPLPLETESDERDGRRGVVTDTVPACREAIMRVAALLSDLGVAPDRILTLPDRHSAALGAATSVLLGLPAVEFTDDPEADGLVVAYDLARLPFDVAEVMRIQEPGQVLWAHASQWTTDHEVTPDICSFLYRSAAPPWGDDASAALEQLVDGRTPDPEGSDARVVALAEATRDLDDHRASVLRNSGRRSKQWALPDPR